MAREFRTRSPGTPETGAFRGVAAPRGFASYREAVVLEEKLTPEYARREYGVAIDVEARKVLPEESAQLRLSMARS